MSTDKLLPQYTKRKHKSISGEVKNKSAKRLVTNSDYVDVRFRIEFNNRVIQFEGSGIDKTCILNYSVSEPNIDKIFKGIGSESRSDLVFKELAIYLSYKDYPDNVIAAFILSCILNDGKEGVFSKDKGLEKCKTLLLYDKENDEFKISMCGFLIRRIMINRTGNVLEDFLMTYYNVRFHMWSDYFSINYEYLEKLNKDMKVFKDMSSVVN